MAEKKSEKKLAQYLVNSVSRAQTKGGKPYLRMQLFEKGGRAWPSIFWEDKDLASGAVIDAMVEESEFMGQAQLVVHALRVIPGVDVEEFLPKSKCDTEAMWEELRAFAGSVGDTHLRALLEKATADPRWKRAPAAKAMHHAYIGGLLEHSLNLCRRSKLVAKLYQDLRIDRVL